jgi:DNA modification methylase
MKMEIIYKQTSELIPYINNPRKNDKAVDAVASSIKNFGFKVPVIIDSQGEIIAGHTRLKAAKKLNIKEVPCLIADDLTPAQIKAFRIADNKVSESAEWDIDLLKIEIQDLDEFTGFELEELNIMFEEEKEITEDEVPEVQEEVITKLGDLYEIGEHRLLCGDSTDSEQVAKLMNGEKAELLLTDPPYGIKADKGFSGSKGFSGKGKPIKRKTYNDNWDSKRPEQSTFLLILENCKNSIIFGGNFFADILPISTHWIVWDKLNTMPTFGDCELAWTNFERKSVKKYTVQYNGLIGKELERYHPTQKPIKIMTSIINDYSKSNSLILDTFIGSGSTMVACHQLNRKCYGMEIDPKYCDVIIRRMINLDPDIIIKRNGIDCKEEFTK